MPMPSEEEIRLLLKVGGLDSVEEAIAAFRRMKDETGGLTREQEKSLIALEYYASIQRKATDVSDVATVALVKQTEAARLAAIEQRNLAAALDEDTRAQEALATTTATTATAHGDMGRGILQASYAVQDFTSSLSGGQGLGRAIGSVQNNIPLLLTSLGVGAGLAGTISLVSVGLGAVIPLLQSFAGEAKSAAGDVQKLADEAARIRGEKTTEESDTASVVGKFLKEGKGGQVVSGGILQALTLESEGKRTPEEQELLDATMATTGPDVGAAGVVLHPQLLWKAMQSRRNHDQTLRQQADDLLVRLKAGDPAAMADVAQMASKHPGLFPKQTQDLLASASPAAMEADRKADEDLDAEDAERQGRKQARFERARRLNEEAKGQKKAREKQDRLSDDLTIQGQNFEDRLRHDNETAAAKEKAEKDRVEQQVAVATRQANERQEREQERAERQAKHEAEKAARENTPDKRKDRAIAQEINAQGGATADPDFVRQVAAQASRNVTMGADIATAVQLAVEQTQRRIMIDFQRGMGRMQVNSESFLP